MLDETGEIYKLSHYTSGEYEGMTLIEMTRDYGGPMFCKIEGEFCVDTRETCGYYNCDDYSPCNGKSGRCRHLVNGFMETGKKYKVHDSRIVRIYELRNG